MTFKAHNFDSIGTMEIGLDALVHCVMKLDNAPVCLRSLHSRDFRRDGELHHEI